MLLRRLELEHTIADVPPLNAVVLVNAPETDEIAVFVPQTDQTVPFVLYYSDAATAEARAREEAAKLGLAFQTSVHLHWADYGLRPKT